MPPCGRLAASTDVAGTVGNSGTLHSGLRRSKCDHVTREPQSCELPGLESEH